jgi:hypothetical protein
LLQIFVEFPDILVVRNVAPAEEAGNNDGDAKQGGTIFAATLSANPTDHCMCSGLGGI